MKSYRTSNIAISALAIGEGLLPLSHAGSSGNIKRWQNSVLFNPSPAQLKREQSGSIMIYDGLSDRVVDSALDSQFDRINSMMFTRVIVTDEQGDNLIDPDTGDFVVEDDGCD